MTKDMHYAICVDDCGSPASLEVRMVYRVMEDEDARGRGLVRVVDDSDEDYLYPATSFVPIEVPRAAVKAFVGKTV